MRHRVERKRLEALPTTKKLPQRDSDNHGREASAALQHTSRFRAHDDVEEGGHVYLTARYTTRFD
jgi:hypothetical protein